MRSAPRLASRRALRPALFTARQPRCNEFLVSRRRAAVTKTAGIQAALVSRAAVPGMTSLAHREVRGSRCICAAPRLPLLPCPLRFAPGHTDMLGNLSRSHARHVARAVSIALHGPPCAHTTSRLRMAGHCTQHVIWCVRDAPSAIALQSVCAVAVHLESRHAQHFTAAPALFEQHRRCRACDAWASMSRTGMRVHREAVRRRCKSMTAQLPCTADHTAAGVDHTLTIHARQRRIASLTGTGSIFVGML